MRKAQISNTLLSILGMLMILAVFVGMAWLIAYAIRHGATVVAATLAGLATIGSAVIYRYYDRRTKPKTFGARS